LKQAPRFFVSTRHFTTNARETEDRAQMSTAQQRADFVLVSLALRVTPWVRVLSWHATATINSSLALGDNGFRPKRLAERSTASILETAATTSWSTALARNISGRKNLAERQGTYWWALPRTRAWLPGKFWNCVFVDKEGYPYFVQTELLLFLLQSRSPLTLARDALWRKQAILDNFLRVHPQRPMVLRKALPDFGIDNLLNGVILPS
jgi:hypothetical protein